MSVVLRSGPERLTEAAAWVRERASLSRPLWVLAPTRRAADDFMLGAAQQAEAPLLGVHRSTPGQLAQALAREAMARAGLAPSTALSERGLNERAIQRCRCQLEHFGPLTALPGFLPALCRTIEGLRRAFVTPAQLDTGSPGARDLARLLRAYEAELEDQRMADNRARFALAEAALAPLPALLLLDLPLPNPLERRWIAHLLAASEDSWVSLPQLPPDQRRWWEDRADPQATTDPAQLHPDQALQAPPPSPAAPPPAAPTGDPEDPDDAPQQAAPATDGPQQAAQANTPAGARAGALQPPEGVIFDFFSGASEDRECAEIVRQALRLARDEGVRFDDMAVFLRDPQRYQGLLLDACARAEIPVFSTRSLRRPRPAGRALLALLRCATEGLSAARFAEYLSFAQVPALPASGAPEPPGQLPWAPPSDEGQLTFLTPTPSAPTPTAPLDPDAAAVAGDLQAPRRWEALLVEASVIGGDPARWRQRLGGLSEELKAQIALLEREGEGDEADQRRAQLRALGHLERFALPLIQELAELPTQAPWLRWLEALRALAARSLAEPEPVLALLTELAPLRGEAEIDRLELLRVLHEPLSKLPAETDRDRFGKLLLAPPEAAAGRQFSVVFLPGLVEGGFPRPLREDPLLPDAEAGPLGLPTLRDKAEAERRAAQLAVSAAQRWLLASYPRVDLKRERARVPSTYALELLRGRSGALPPLSELNAKHIAGRDSPGWPAPKDPAQAIDLVEYNLAVLAPLVYAPPEQARGRGRYLVKGDKAAPWVRALRYAELRSATPEVFTPADGLVENAKDAAPVAEALQAASLRRRAYSPTALEQFSVCPFRFAMKALFRLRPPETAAPLDELDPLTRGSLIHDVMFHFFRARRDQGPLLPEGLEPALETLRDTIQARFAFWKERLLPAVDSVWHKERAQITLDLCRWLRDRVSHPDSFDGARGWEPVAAELAFGLPPSLDHDEASSRSPVPLLGGYQVRGIVDLIERSAASGRVRVIDYKTGADYLGDGSFVTAGGRCLQPMLYALAVRAQLDARVCSGELDFCTRRGGFQRSVVDLTPLAEDITEQALATIDRAICHAFLPALPHRRDPCARCELSAACPQLTRESPTKHHDPRAAELKDLRELR